MSILWHDFCHIWNLKNIIVKIESKDRKSYNNAYILEYNRKLWKITLFKILTQFITIKILLYHYLSSFYIKTPLHSMSNYTVESCGTFSTYHCCFLEKSFLFGITKETALMLNILEMQIIITLPDNIIWMVGSSETLLKCQSIGDPFYA